MHRPVRAASASHIPPAGPRPGSARRRAAGCAPPSAASPPARAVCCAAAQRSSRRGDQIGTARRVAGSVGPEDRRPRSGGSAVVSGRITSGACNPLAPCTVITRTRLPAASASRFTSAPERRSQCRNPCSDGGCMRRIRQRGVQQFVHRFRRLRTQPREQPRPAAERAERLGEQRVRRDVVHARQQCGEERPRPRRQSGRLRRARAQRLPQMRRGGPSPAPSGCRPYRPPSGLVSRQANVRSSCGSSSASASAIRSCTAGCSVSISRSSPATGTPRDFSARTRARAKSLRRRTSTMTSPGASGRPRLSSITPPAVCSAIQSRQRVGQVLRRRGQALVLLPAPSMVAVRLHRAAARAAIVPLRRRGRRDRHSGSASRPAPRRRRRRPDWRTPHPPVPAPAESSGTTRPAGVTPRLVRRLHAVHAAASCERSNSSVSAPWNE